MSSMAQLGVMPESELLAPQSGAPSVPSVDKRSDFGNQSVGRGSRESFGRRTVSFNESDYSALRKARDYARFHELIDEHEADMRALVENLVTRHELDLVRHRIELGNLLSQHLEQFANMVPVHEDGLGLPQDISNQDSTGEGGPRKTVARFASRWGRSGSSLHKSTRTQASLAAKSTEARRGSDGSLQLSEDGGNSRPMQELFQAMQNQLYAGSVLHYVAVTLGIERFETRALKCILRKRLPRGLSSRALEASRSAWFELFAAIAIIFNAAFIAITADNFMDRAVELWKGTDFGASPESARLESQPGFMKVVDLSFAIIFSFEWLVRVLAEEFEFFIGAEWKWNWIDTVSLFSSWAEIALDALSNRTFVDLSLVRMLRILRVVRSIRIVRVLLVFRELRLLLLSLTGSVMPLLWALVVLNVITFMFGILIQQGVASHLVSEETVRSLDDTYEIGEVSGFAITEASKAALIDMFYSFPRTFLTLFKSVTGGENWGWVQYQLESADPTYGFLWCMYIAIMFLGVLNVITGIFVECAVARARTDKEMALLEEMERNKERMKQLMEVFHELDANCDGKVTLDEWESFTTRTEAQAAMALLGLDVRKTKEIYKMLDLNDDQEVDIEEFAVGCMELSGAAKGVDVETLLRNSKKMLANLGRHFYRLETKMENYMLAQSNKVGMAVDHVEKLVQSRTLSEQGSDRHSIASPPPAFANSKDNSDEAPETAGPQLLDMDNNNNNNGKQLNNGAVRKAPITRQHVKKRIASLAQLAQTYVDSARVEEMQLALGAVIRTVDSQSTWTTAVGRSMQSDLDAISIRYGLFHHEEETSDAGQKFVPPQIKV